MHSLPTFQGKSGTTSDWLCGTHSHSLLKLVVGVREGASLLLMNCCCSTGTILHQMMLLLNYLRMCNGRHLPLRGRCCGHHLVASCKITAIERLLWVLWLLTLVDRLLEASWNWHHGLICVIGRLNWHSWSELGHSSVPHNQFTHHASIS